MGQQVILRRLYRTNQYTVDELSIPVVQMMKEIGILPLVGELDTKRAQVLMENALAKGTEYKLK